MKKLYGDALRKDAGVTKTLRNVVVRNAHVLGGVTRSVREVQGTFEKVFEETADAVEEFLNRCGSPPIFLFEQSTDLVVPAQPVPVCLDMSRIRKFSSSSLENASSSAASRLTSQLTTKRLTPSPSVPPSSSLRTRTPPPPPLPRVSTLENPSRSTGELLRTTRGKIG
jgi:hypothetical protein